MAELTNDEVTVLMIAAEGKPMIPIGRWKASTESLVAKGFMQPRPHAGDPTGHFNNYITDAGRKALEEADNQAFRGMIGIAGSMQRAHQELQALAEKIAQDLVVLTRDSVKIKNDGEVKTLRNWSKVILERALEVLKQGNSR